MRRKETCHFWLGNFPSEQRVIEYFQEVYDESDEDREHMPLSEFARDQCENWYDHDFMEYGFNSGVSSIKELVSGYSYHEQYEDELTKRAEKLGLTEVNTFVFINTDQIEHPRSVETGEYALHYVGTITYAI